MKRLIIDGNSVYEIDMDCVKRHKPPEECEIAGYLKNFQRKEDGRKNWSNERNGNIR